MNSRNTLCTNLLVFFLKMLYLYTIVTIILVSVKLALVIFDSLVRSEHMDRDHFSQEQLLLSLSLKTETKNFSLVSSVSVGDFYILRSCDSKSLP